MPEHTPAPTPARSLYGFFMYLFSNTALALYCAWAFIPDSWLHYFNIYYYPQKYWATAVPIQCLVALTMFAFLIYPSLNLMMMTSIDSINTISDPMSHYSVKINENTPKISNACVCTDDRKCMKDSYSASPQDLNENTVPPLHDLNIRFVCKKLYLNKNK
ncbi:phosphatidylinositol N-acetylglucosaminyltransferase subunit P [Pectinophora gossypiella]|uniref:phosphatidylinositol N-acetylglucosaminyltransferase subunit P n=1 Tax=Pectinophora gossypiella TaxID=13191 RepID=UPI00214F1AAC|nr:phosphatidylinositol N-acetylglucosaminyltransferase subunit P [Pectinophora gossypiella]